MSGSEHYGESQTLEMQLQVLLESYPLQRSLPILLPDDLHEATCSCRIHETVNHPTTGLARINESNHGLKVEDEALGHPILVIQQLIFNSIPSNNEPHTTTYLVIWKLLVTSRLQHLSNCNLNQEWSRRKRLNLFLVLKLNIHAGYLISQHCPHRHRGASLKPIVLSVQEANEAFQGIDIKAAILIIVDLCLKVSRWSIAIRSMERCKSHTRNRKNLKKHTQPFIQRIAT